MTTVGTAESNEPQADSLGRVKQTYPSGATYSVFKPDGSGTVFFPNGVIAVNVTAGDGIPPGLYTTIFSNKARKDVIGSWDCLGVGSCLFPNGRVRLCTTMQGGSEYSAEGDLIRSWTWDKRPLKEPTVLQLSDEFELVVKDRSNIRVTFRCMERTMKFEVGKVMRRNDTYLDKVTGVGTGSERGKLTLDVDRCRASLALTQRMRDSFKAAKVDPVMPKQGALDPKVIELANNPSKVTTDSIREQIRVIESITTENAGALHALPYVEHEIGEDGRRRPARTAGADRSSESYRLQQQMAKGWKCLLPRAPPDSEPKRAPVLMGGRFETCTRFAPYLSGKVRLPALRSADYDSFLQSAPRNQPVLVVCVSAAVPLESSRALALAQDAYGDVWAKHGGMDMLTRQCSKRPSELPYQMVSFDMAESRLLTDRHNLKSAPMFLIYYSGRLVYLSNTFTQRYDKKLDERHPVVDRMFENTHRKGFGLTVDDVISTLQQAARDGAAGKFLPEDHRFGAAPSTVAADAAALATIRPFPTPSLANARKRPLLRRVGLEPAPADGIERRLAAVFGRDAAPAQA